MRSAGCAGLGLRPWAWVRESPQQGVAMTVGAAQSRGMSAGGGCEATSDARQTTELLQQRFGGLRLRVHVSLGCGGRLTEGSKQRFDFVDFGARE
jgi:hypothetical protein